MPTPIRTEAGTFRSESSRYQHLLRLQFLWNTAPQTCRGTSIDLTVYREQLVQRLVSVTTPVEDLEP